jgi:broad specificity phosphatase PhoE
MKRAALVVSLLLVASAALAAGRPSLRTVILVRHAEKTSTDADTPLSAAGRARAAELARVLAGANVKAIYVSEFARTQQTAAPLAAKLSLTPVVVHTGNAQAKEIAKKIRAAPGGDTLLVVGHSNTIPKILAELGVAAPPAIAEGDYGDLFICTVPDKGTPTVVQVKFGG